MITKDISNFSNKKITAEDFNKAIISNDNLTLFHGLSPLKELNIESNFNKIENGLLKILSGEIANPSENQSVTHHECRDPNKQNNNHLFKFISDVLTKKITISGKPITHVCQIGVGGSSSGPKAIYQAIKSWNYEQAIKGSFINSQDEQHISAVLNDLPISNTLFIIASKSGTTIEVVKAIETILKLTAIPEEVFYKQQCVTITTEKSPLNSNKYLEKFTFKESVGGRFSTTSQIGTLLLGLCFGKNIVTEFLSGAFNTDQIELSNQKLNSNIAFQTALLNTTYRNKFHFNQLGIIPYGEALKDIPFFIVQLISESLGKGATITGIKSTTNNCPQITYGLGPDAQHSFFQQLHQSKSVTPCEFITAKPSTKNQQHMLQQICGQMVALAQGKTDSDANHHFTGNRPSILIYLQSQTPKALGALIASYENRVIFESLLLNINAFDQPGVELGKKLTKEISKSGTDLASQIFQTII